MPQGGANSFFRFTLGFTVFIALSLGITYAVNTIEIAARAEKQAAAAFQTMLGKKASDSPWWKSLLQ